MAKNTGSDYIPTTADLIAAEEARKSWVEAHPPALKNYKITYTMFGSPAAPVFKTSTTQAGALDVFMRECNTVGIVPYNVVCEEVK